MNVDEAMEIATSTAITLSKLEMAEVSEVIAAEVERLRAELAAAKTAGELPVEIQSVYVNKYLGTVVVFIGDEKGAVAFDAWLCDRVKDKTPPEA